MSTRNRIALLQARSSKVAKLKIQVFRLKIGKELSNMREIEKSLKTKNGKTVIRIVGDLVKMCTDGIYLTKKTKKLGNILVDQYMKTNIQNRRKIKYYRKGHRRS